MSRTVDVLALAIVLAGAVIAQPARSRVSASRAVPAPSSARVQDLVWIPAGRYQPLYKRTLRDSTGVATSEPAPAVKVPGFWLSPKAVTNGEYLEFVRRNPQWRRSQARRLFVDEGYLRHWRGDLELGDSVLAASPVVNVSWFAARAYCASRGRVLPTVDQWEYVAAASETKADATRDAKFQDRLRAWYSQPTPRQLPVVGSTFRDLYGIWDMHGLVWEWTADFSSAMVTGESRGDAALDKSLFCGSGAANAADFRDYAAFMRYAFRSSLSARYCVANLGFREAVNADRGPAPAPRSQR